VIKLAKKYNIKIYTIAIAATNTFTLNQLSTQTKGKTFRAHSKESLKDIYMMIDNLEKSKIEKNKLILKEYYFFYPLMFSFLFLLFFVYLKNRREN
jgi:Ca-activated chloride channel family protein